MVKVRNQHLEPASMCQSTFETMINVFCQVFPEHSHCPGHANTLCLELQNVQDCHITDLQHVSEHTMIFLSPSPQEGRGKSSSGLTLVVWQ